MRKINANFLFKQPVDAAFRAPKPFPGKYPTKVAYFVGKKMLYIGKPNRVEALKYSRLPGPKSEGEFDRGGILRVAKLNEAGQVESIVSPHLYKYYHPWSKRNAGGRLAEFEKPFFTKRAKALLEAKTRSIYSPYAVPRLTAFDEHRAWVAKVNWNVA